MKKNNFILNLIFLISLLFSSNDNQEYVVLVSFDGFRHDYVDRFELPYFEYIEKWGVKANSLKPIFPSFTFPNHYAIATGCYADKHKIIGNVFKNELGQYSYKDKTTVQDAKWYGAEPIWVTAEKNGLISATYFWVGSEAPIGGIYPTYYKNYESGINPYDKVDKAVDWLQLPLSSRPNLVCLYFNEPDYAGHVYGANSVEVDQQIKASNEILGYLLSSLTKLDIFDKINLIILSDHGMVDVSINQVINIDEFNIPGTIDGRGPIMSLKLNDKKKFKIEDLIIPNVSIVSSVNNKILHYDNSIYDYLLVADEGWMIYKNEDLIKYSGNLPVIGMHGYSSDYKSMHAIFYAYGPRFKPGYKLDTFELIHVYPLICDLLQIEPNNNIDGDINVLKQILK